MQDDPTTVGSSAACGYAMPCLLGEGTSVASSNASGKPFPRGCGQPVGSGSATGALEGRPSETSIGSSVDGPRNQPPTTCWPPHSGWPGCAWVTAPPGA